MTTQDTDSAEGLTRRSFLHGSAIGVGSVTLAGGLVGQALNPQRGLAARRRVVPLPSAAQLGRDIQRMVDFGPRLPGYAAHNAYCDWLEDEFVKAGLELETCDEYPYDRWQLEGYTLDVLGGRSPHPIRVAFPYVRSAGTGPRGIVAPLSYAQADATGAVQSGAVAPGSIAVIDVPWPQQATLAGVLTEALSEYWPGHTAQDFASIDFTRVWAAPTLDLSSWEQMGAAGVVLILTGSYEAVRGSFSPHQAPMSTSIPVFAVDRDAGAALRELAKAGRTARMTLNAPVQHSAMRTVTAILPGRSDETIICTTHSDGQNAIEENGGVALLALARHFASLPRAQRPTRTLVFAIWSAHMTDPHIQPELDGWLRTHPDLVEHAVAGVAIEHLGCTEWLDDPVAGYHGTGQNEFYGIWTTEGPTQALAQPLVAGHNLARTALLHGPVVISVGEFFQPAGIPYVAGIAGPNYLLVISDSAEIEKLNFDLASRQVAFYADMVKAFDTADPDQLRTGDPYLGTPTQDQPTTGGNQSQKVVCGPPERTRRGRKQRQPQTYFPRKK
jgi:hypothetical protein